MMTIKTTSEDILISNEFSPMFSMCKEGSKSVIRIEVSGNYLNLQEMFNKIDDSNLKSISYNKDTIFDNNNKYIHIDKRISTIGEISKHSPLAIKDDRLKLNLEISVITIATGV